MSTAGMAAALLSTAPFAAAEAPEEARLAACDIGVVLSEYDYTDLDAYAQRVLERSTGEWYAEFSSSFPELRDRMRAVEVRSTAGEVRCGTLSGDATRAEVLVHLRQDLRKAATNGQVESQQVVMVMVLENVGGRWLVSRVTAA